MSDWKAEWLAELAFVIQLVGSPRCVSLSLSFVCACTVKHFSQGFNRFDFIVEAQNISSWYIT